MSDCCMDAKLQVDECEDGTKAAEVDEGYYYRFDGAKLTKRKYHYGPRCDGCPREHGANTWTLPPKE